MQEIDELYEKILDGVKETDGIDSLPESLKGSIVYYHQCLQRDRRVLLAYLVYRLDKIRALKWETGPVIPDRVRSIISDRESDYFMEYNKVVTSYCNDIGLDLTSDLEVSRMLQFSLIVLYLTAR